MQALDVSLRVAGATLLLALAALLLRDARHDRPVPLFFLLALGLSGFLAGNTPDAGLKLPGQAAVLAGIVSGNAVVFLWWFCLAVFDDEFSLGWRELGLGAAWFVVSLLDRGVLRTDFAGSGLSWLLIGVGLGMVAHVVYKLLRDREGDLVEARRTARRTLVIALVALLLSDFGVDVVLGFDWKPQWFTIAQNTAIVLVAAQMGNWLLRTDSRALAFRAVRSDTPSAEASPPAPRAHAEVPDARLMGRLGELMQSQRIHRDAELSFAAFVARMGAPEAEVRRLINRQLGHRHFRSFLNSYRVAEARDALADPDRSGEKMVAIAFAAGFGSLASFNRAFSLATGLSPTEYRAQTLAREPTRPPAADPP